MKTERIIQTILATQRLQNRTIYLAAMCAQSGVLDAKRDVQNWWLQQGGTVDDMGPLVKPGDECRVSINGAYVSCIVKQATCDEFVLTVKSAVRS